jgi:predicted transcriptional regulator of viral defense system
MQDDSTDIWEALYAVIEAQSGYFTVGQAKECGYSDQLLRYHRNKGRFQSILRGVYRMTHFPPTDHEDLIAIWLWSEMKGVFSHETALVLHQLSDSLPSSIHVTFPRSWKKRRLRYPDSVAPVFDDVDSEERRWYGCVPVTTPSRTIKDCRAAHVDPLIIEQAVEEGLARGLFSRNEIVP